jgi:hypothetical protein
VHSRARPGPISWEPVLMQVCECAAREKQIMYNRASAFQRLGYATGATQPAQIYIHDSHTLSARAEMHFLRRGVRTGMSPPRRNRIMQIARASRQSNLVCAVSGLDSCLVRKSAPKVSPNLATNSKSRVTIIVFASKLSSEFSSG